MSNAHEDYPGEDYAPPAALLIAGKEVKAGASVRLRPGRGRQSTHTDALDMLLDGKTARVRAASAGFRESRLHSCDAG